MAYRDLGVPPIPPIDASLPGYNAMGAVSGMTSASTPSSANLRTFGVGEGSVPAGAGHSGSNLRQAYKDEGIGGDAPPSKLSGLLGDIGSGVSILGDLAQIYLGFQQQKQAKREFRAQMGFANANLENTVKSYNTRLADIYTARGYTQGNDQAATQQAITANSLNFQRIKG